MLIILPIAFWHWIVRGFVAQLRYPGHGTICGLQMPVASVLMAITEWPQMEWITSGKPIYIVRMLIWWWKMLSVLDLQLVYNSTCAFRLSSIYIWDVMQSLKAIEVVLFSLIVLEVSGLNYEGEEVFQYSTPLRWGAMFLMSLIRMSEFNLYFIFRVDLLSHRP